MDAKFEPTSPEDPEVLALFDAFIREADGPLGIDLEAEIAAGPPAELAGPDGVLLLVRVEGEPAGLGAVRHLDTDVAEVKTMYLSPAHRGQGLARRLLTELEEIARGRGCRAVRLDTLRLPDRRRRPLPRRRLPRGPALQREHEGEPLVRTATRRRADPNLALRPSLA